MHARSEVCVDHPHVVEAGQAPAMEVAIADCFHHEKAHISRCIFQSYMRRRNRGGKKERGATCQSSATCESEAPPQRWFKNSRMSMMHTITLAAGSIVKTQNVKYFQGMPRD